MGRDLIVLGVIFAVTGFAILSIGSITTSKSEVWLDESFNVPALSYTARYGTFLSDKPLHISFTVIGGDINFEVMDENDYLKMKIGETYQYYIAPSKSEVSNMNVEWIPPSNKKIYFVWFNLDSAQNKSVSTRFYHTSQSKILPFPREISYSSILLFIGGLTVCGYGLLPKSSQRSISWILSLASIIVLMGLGFFDGIVIKEKVFEPVVGGVIIASIIIWVIISAVWDIILFNEESSGGSGSYVVWQDFFGIIHIDDAEEMYKVLAVFLITGLIWALPFVLVLLFVP